ncbi:MAG TPA: hypothetical protein PKC29_14890 [Thermodesulfobacteriota bacterium]|nr:hypothetical protein [Thermodesulfobacteriota bacterium]
MNIDKNLSAVFIKQLEEILHDYQQIVDSDYPVEGVLELTTRSRAAIERIVPQSSPYFKQSEDMLKTQHHVLALQAIIGVVRSLRHDISKGYLQNFTELIHGVLFVDFLEMSHHLLKEGYKDAAAVIAGSSLEAHLRQLCVRNGIDTEYEREGDVRPKKADALNAELGKAKIYSILDQKSVTAWLDLRNDAAHGHYDKYVIEQVSLMISGIRDFILRNPA